MRRAALLAGGLACLALAALLALLAADVDRWRDALRDGDVGYRAEPAAARWSADGLLPFGATESLLGVSDDVAFRQALRAVRLSRPDLPSGYDPAYVVLRNEAASRLNLIVRGGGDARTRSAATNLLGVLVYSEATFAFENKISLFSAAAQRFRDAIRLDPANGDAKFNLEVTLTRQAQLELAEAAGGDDPAPGGQGARGAGAADAGSGY